MNSGIMKQFNYDEYDLNTLAIFLPLRSEGVSRTQIRPSPAITSELNGESTLKVLFNPGLTVYGKPDLWNVYEWTTNKLSNIII
jgi:hypothetical protein